MLVRKIIWPLIVLPVLSVSLVSCHKEPEFPKEPVIKYVDLQKIPTSEGIDDKGILKISFTDGDGDIGLAQSDTTPPYDKNSMYYYNFIIKYFEKQKGVFKEIVVSTYNYQTGLFDTLSFNSRIPILNASGDEKPLEGDIELELFINNYASKYDTIQFKMYIIDRALHKSNEVSSPEIVIKKK